MKYNKIAVKEQLKIKKEEQIKMAKRITVGNPINTAKKLNELEKKHGKTVDGSNNLVSINGENILLAYRTFEDGFNVGFNDEYAPGSFYNYEWDEEKNTYLRS